LTLTSHACAQQVVAGNAVAGEWVGLESVPWLAYRTVDVSALCADRFGNTGATGKAVVSVDHFLTMSSWLATPDSKKRFELSDPVVTGSPIRTAQVRHRPSLARVRKSRRLESTTQGVRKIGS
jgi:hypothetical protein